MIFLRSAPPLGAEPTGRGGSTGQREGRVGEGDLAGRGGAALADVAMQRGRYIILFVRPSGFRTLTEVRGYLDLLGAEMVEVPIEQSWQRIRVQ